MMGLAMTNYASPDENGHSVAFAGIAIETPDAPSRDMRLVEAGEEEGVFLAEFPERGPGIFVKILIDIYQYYLLIEFTFILLDKNYSKVIYDLSKYIN